MNQQPTGIKTNGINKRTVSHLNLTKTMADVIDDRRDVLILLSTSRGAK